MIHTQNTKNRENIEFISVFSTQYLLQVAGLEPARCCHRGILSPLRLPIPPHLLIQVNLEMGPTGLEPVTLCL